LNYLDKLKLKDILSRLEALEKEVIFLRKENAELKERLARYEIPKNSRNSSIPPSKD
jgi:regulator of replication initiation timing